MSNRVYQGMVRQMRDAVGRELGIVDENDLVTACSDLQRVGEPRLHIREELAYSGGSALIGGYTYRCIGASPKSDPVVFVEGDDEIASRAAAMLAVTVNNLKNLYDEKYDRGSFIKNIMLDNILQSDIYLKSKELHFDSEERRVVLIVKLLGKTDVMLYDVLQNMFPDKQHNYIISIGEQDIVLVRELGESGTMEETVQIAESIVETMNTEFYTRVVVGVSSVAENLKVLARAYKEARIAIEVGKVFDTERSVICHENLGIGRLVYQLPTTLCEDFLQEVFRQGSLESLDRETLMTVQSFFENNLNVSETSRKLFVHRNTLVYRLEKIRKITGLDLREFDHAVTFKVALMVKKYLANKPAKF